MGVITINKSAQQLYADMLVDAPRQAVLRTAIEDFGVRQEDGDLLFDGFLQWIAALPGRPANEQYVMLKSDIDRIFHAFILNTRLYREFCETHLGRFIDHHPITGDGVRPDVEATIRVLRAAYGEDLNPFLALWERDLAADAWIVSCVQ